jgi:hypothetical protein
MACRRPYSVDLKGFNHIRGKRNTKRVNHRSRGLAKLITTMGIPKPKGNNGCPAMTRGRCDVVGKECPSWAEAWQPLRQATPAHGCSRATSYLL